MRILKRAVGANPHIARRVSCNLVEDVLRDVLVHAVCGSLMRGGTVCRYERMECQYT